MGLFDSIVNAAKNAASSAVRHEANKAVNTAVNNAVNNAAQAVGKGRNHSERFIFNSLPTNLSELQALPEASLDSAFKTAALTVAALCNFERDPEETFRMLDFLKGPEDVSTYERQFIRERLSGKYYKSFSFFDGATPQNDYKPSVPYALTVSENPYSFDNENWATLWVKSSGADDPYPIKFRKKPSTGQWFLNDIQCLSDIRIPVSTDKWA